MTRSATAETRIEPDTITPQDAEILTHLHPCANRLIITQPEVSAYHSGRKFGPLHIPDTALSHLKEFGMVATVLAVGPDCDPDLTPGAKVVIPEYAGKPIYFNRPLPYWIISEGEVLVVLTEDTHNSDPADE